MSLEGLVFRTGRPGWDLVKKELGVCLCYHSGDSEDSFRSRRLLDLVTAQGELGPTGVVWDGPDRHSNREEGKREGLKVGLQG